MRTDNRQARHILRHILKEKGVDRTLNLIHSSTSTDCNRELQKKKNACVCQLWVPLFSTFPLSIDSFKVCTSLLLHILLCVEYDFLAYQIMPPNITESLWLETPRNSEEMNQSEWNVCLGERSFSSLTSFSMTHKKERPTETENKWRWESVKNRQGGENFPVGILLTRKQACTTN